MLVINGDKKIVRVLCIHYLIRFQERQIKVLLDSGSKVNTINPKYTWKLSFKIRKTKFGAQEINGSTLETFGMVIANFQVKDKVSKSGFFQKTFLVANIKFEIILRILILKISNSNVLFGKKTLT